MMLLLLLTGVTASAQPDEAALDSLRQRDDFVTASLLVATPGAHLYSALGHCALRMECPAFGLDYCFSFEMNSGNDATDYLNFFKGQSPSGIIAMETPAYLQRFKDEGRGVTQYTLNLTPVQKQEMWRRLDNNLMEGISTHFDFLYHNCTSTCFAAIRGQLLDEHLEVKEWPEMLRLRAAFTLQAHTRHAPWLQFALMTIGGSKADEDAPKELCVAPEDFGETLAHSVIVSTDGTERPALTGEVRQLLPQTLQLQPTWLTPLVLAATLLALLLLLTAGEWLWGWRRLARATDVVLLVVQALLGVLLLYLVMVSNLFGQHWNWCLLIFSPLPLLAWLCCRRRGWYGRLALLYGGILLLLAVASPLITAQLIAAHRLTAAAIAVRCLSCAWAENRKTK